MPIDGFSVRIYLPHGDPSGLRLVEKSNWTGQAIAFPRSLFTRASEERLELKRTGVYLLWGQDESSPHSRLYIGQTDSVGRRLGDHVTDARLDFWTNTVAFTSKDDAMNSAHVRYLESKLIGLASHSNRCDLANTQNPPTPPISEADRVDAENFLEDMLICMPLVGLRAFQQEPVSGENSVSEQTKEQTLSMKAVGIEAQGRSVSDGFLVLEDSGARGDVTESMNRPEFGGYLALRQTLISQQVLVEESDSLRFSTDYHFNSLSAATFVIGGTQSPYDTWKDATGKSLRSIQAEVETMNDDA